MDLTSSSQGVAIKVNGASTVQRYSWNGASWASEGTVTGGDPNRYGDALTRSHDNKMLWNQATTSGSAEEYVRDYQASCSCWASLDVPSDGTNYDGYAIAGMSQNEAWSGGVSGQSSQHAALRHYTGAAWQNADSNFASSMMITALDFSSHSDGWAGAENALYHYTGQNNAPAA